jgi:hypothetical protein
MWPMEDIGDDCVARRPGAFVGTAEIVAGGAGEDQAPLGLARHLAGAQHFGNARDRYRATAGGRAVEHDRELHECGQQGCGEDERHHRHDDRPGSVHHFCATSATNI